METTGRQPWLRTVILFGVLYLVVGIAFGWLAFWSASHQMRVVLRQLAFLTSALGFAAHIVYEHFRFGNSPRITAAHASMAVALGAFALAVAANIHGLLVASSHQRLLTFALVAWPALTAVRAFVVALVAATVLTLRRRSTQ